MTIDPPLLLKSIPDSRESEPSATQIEDWLTPYKNVIRSLSIESIDWNTIQVLESPAESKVKPAPDRNADPNWRRWVLGLFLADLISYPEASDQAELHRLAAVAAAFPQGFSLYSIQISGAWWPVGYTGWYPITSQTFKILEKKAESLQNRRVTPSSLNPAEPPFLYLFNYSVASVFKKTPLSKLLMSRYAGQIKNQTPQGLAAIAVSEDGSRVAKRFGMELTGQFKVDHKVDQVFTCRL
jgi:hypothetical protein